MIALCVNWNPSNFWTLNAFETQFDLPRTWFSFIMYQMSCDVFHSVKNYVDISCRDYFSALKFCGNECWFSNFLRCLPQIFWYRVRTAILCVRTGSKGHVFKWILKSNHCHPIVHKFEYQISDLKKYSNFIILRFLFYFRHHSLNFLLQTHLYSKVFIFPVHNVWEFYVLLKFFMRILSFGISCALHLFP
jgi:hypothetical protein